MHSCTQSRINIGQEDSAPQHIINCSLTYVYDNVFSFASHLTALNDWIPPSISLLQKILNLLSSISFSISAPNLTIGSATTLCLFFFYRRPSAYLLKRNPSMQVTQPSFPFWCWSYKWNCNCKKAISSTYDVFRQPVCTHTQRDVVTPRVDYCPWL